MSNFKEEWFMHLIEVVVGSFKSHREIELTRKAQNTPAETSLGEFGPDTSISLSLDVFVAVN